MSCTLNTKSRLSTFTLTSHQHELVASLLGNHSDKLRELIYGLGSPLHIVLPQVFRENILRFKQTLSENNPEGMVFYAQKANKANCFTKACADSDIGVDVASEEELAKTLAGGVTGKRIGISGPEKSSSLLNLGLRHQCLIAIDSLSELQRILALATQLRTTARLLLRVAHGAQKLSRFGLTTEECRHALSLCVQKTDPLKLEGFSFHLEGYSLPDRAKVANYLVDMCLEAQSLGLKNCRYVNIGGGFPVQYVNPTLWSEFKKMDSPRHYHTGKRFPSFYPYGTITHGAAALKEILDHPIEPSISLVSKLRQYGVRIICEPGRALLDQAGFTLFKVQGVKNHCDKEDYSIVTVEGSSLSLSEQWFNSEFLPDPVLLGTQLGSDRAFTACIGGSTCLEGDMLTWRKIAFPRAIVPGDCLIYLNTAAYQMDSNESQFHEIPLPRKAVINYFYDSKRLIWNLDDTSF